MLEESGAVSGVGGGMEIGAAVGYECISGLVNVSKGLLGVAEAGALSGPVEGTDVEGRAFIGLGDESNDVAAADHGVAQGPCHGLLDMDLLNVIWDVRHGWKEALAGRRRVL